MGEVLKDIFQGGGYSTDKNLSRLFSDQVVYAEFWISRLSVSGVIKLNLCYGLISEARADSPTEWRKSDFKSVIAGIKASEELSYKIAKISIVNSGLKISKLVDELLTGKNFKEACESSELPDLDSKFHFVKLIKSKKNDAYAFRPPITALPISMLNTLAERRQGYSSPIKNTIATVGSLYFLDKEELWRDTEGMILPSSRDIIRGLTQHLTTQTGLQFNQFDLKRIGNIEWIHYSSIDKYENNLCSVSTTKRLIDSKTKQILPADTAPNSYEHIISCTAVSISINPQGLPTNSEDILVECSAYNDNDLIGDQAEIVKYGSSVSLSFEFDEQLSSCNVKVWSKSDSDKTFTLWHNEHFDLIRTISVGVGYPSQPENSWFESLLSGTSKPGNGARSKKQSNDFRHYGKDFSLDPWNPIGRAARELGYKVYPLPSDAFFFVMPGEDDAPRINAIAEWLTKTILKRKPNTCILFDPYFDTLGVDLLRSTKNAQTNFVIVTNSQLASADDDKSMSDYFMGLEKVVSSRLHPMLNKPLSKLTGIIRKVSKKKNVQRSQIASKIEEYCETHHSSLKRISVKIYDLVSQNGGAKQYFHDRHLLFFDENGRLTSGYNFSNSIQGAMKKYPLLITPIPSDIIESVEKHTYEFLSEKINGSQRKLDLLYSSRDKKEKHIRYKTGIDALSAPSKFFSILLNDNSLRSLSSEKLSEKLTRNGVIEEDGGFVDEKIFLNSKNVVNYLSKLPPDFWEVWCDLSEVLARTHDHDKIISALALSPAIVTKIKDILCSANIGDFKQFVSFVEDLDELEKYIGLKTDSFSLALTKTRNVEYFSMRHYVNIHKYGLGMAIELVCIANELPTIIEELLSAKSSDTNRQVIRLRCVEEICQQLEIGPSVDLLNVLAKSKVAFLRALMAHQIYEHKDKNKELFDLEWIKKHLSSEETVLVFAEWIYDLRVRANQKGGTILEEDGTLYAKLIQELLSIWSFSSQILKDVLVRCSGPLFGSWSVENHNDICIPLIEDKKLTYEELAEVWLKELLSKIEGVTTNKSHFYAPTDASLTAVASHTFANLDHSTMKSYFVEIKNLIIHSLQQVDRPRIKSIDYNLWYYNSNALYWLHALLLHIKSYEKYISTDITEEILKLEKQIEPFTLNENLEINSNSTLEWLLEVKVKIKSQNTKDVSSDNP